MAGGWMKPKPLTFAAPSILLQNIAFRAGALVTPFCVFAYKIAGFGSLVALIQICDQRETESKSPLKRLAECSVSTPINSGKPLIIAS